MRPMSPTRRSSRTLTVALICSLVVTGVSTSQVANAAGGPSVPLPETSSTAVSQQTMQGRAPDEASLKALTGNQPAGSTTPDGGGSSKATSLSPSATWDVSEQTGDFAWSYPLRVPPVPGDLQPNLALSYTSSAVDGRTSATNNQASWVGDGWDLHPGFVERSYGGCQDDKEGGTTPPRVGDLCWKSDNAIASYNGSGGRLVYDTSKKVWRQKSDNGSRIEHLTGAGNGARDGEYWKITTVDGTQYFFGSASASKSTWTVPVYGDDVGEPCHAADNKFENSACVQAYRWNLDKVVDRHGNLILYTYDIETNNYGQNVKDTPVSYVRGGTLKEIQYGLREGESTPATGKVTFATEERCVPGSSKCTFGNPENFPDVPLVDRCEGATCKDHYSPTFWSTKRLAKITTQVRRDSGYRDVDSWTLDHQFPDPDDGNKAALWLKGITHAGHVGMPISLPKVTFEGKKLPNRVVKDDGVGPLNRYRLSAIVSEAGGVTTVNYAPADCTATSLPDKPETNTKRCFPVTWTKRDFAERTDYFNKYVVGSIVESDRIGSSAEQVTSYSYPDGAAWHYTTVEFVSEKDKTWNEFRGFGRVIVRSGTPNDPSGPMGYTETRYFRGMNGDKLPNNTTRSVTVPDSEGGAHVDEDWLHGFTLESITKNGEAGAVVGKTITAPSWQGPTATQGALKAYLVHTGTRRGYTALASGGWRVTRSTTYYDVNGLPAKINDEGDINAGGDERCTNTTYAQNTERWLLSFPSRVETVAKTCGFPPQYPDETISDVRLSYDTLGHGVSPTVGDVTLAEEIDRYEEAKPLYRTAAKTKRDVYGRALEITDADGNTATSTYTPTTGGPVTQLVTANALGHKTTTVYETAWGSARTITDPNNRVTEIDYDALGRKVEVWQPNRPRSENAQGNARFIYDVRNDAPSSVTTTQIGPNGNYATSTTILDSLYRTRQAQAPAPGGGRLLVDTRYDSQGRAYKTTQPFYNDKPVDTSLWVASDTEVPGLTVTEFDGAGRATASIYQAGGIDKWRTTKTYRGDSVSVTPPAGGVATTTITDARGRTRSLLQHHDAAPFGADETKYEYTASDKLAALTDSSGNRWSYTYDIHGSLIRTDDPDRGETSYTYNKLNQQTSSKDARNVTLAFSYDKLGRKTGVFKDNLAGTKLSEWTYDTAVKGIGQPASSTRWVDGNAYVKKVNAYGPLYQPIIQSVIIPPIEGAKLAGSYQSFLQYNPDGSLGGLGVPKAGDLSVESMLYLYDDLGNLLSTEGGVDDDYQDYVSGTEYTRYGEPQRLQLGGESSTNTDGKRAWLSYYYDTNTRRLDRTIVDAEVPRPMQTDTNYSYNPAGNITSIANVPLGQLADNQCFRYDYLQRLTEAWTPGNSDCAPAPAVNGLGGPAPYWQSFTYDKSGNRTGDTQHSSGGDVTRKYSYAAPGTPKPHILNSVTSEGPAGAKTAQYTYDELGNTKTRPGGSGQQNLDWNAENKLEKVTEGASDTTFLYDADGNRLIRRDPAGTTLYLGSQEVRLDKASGNATTTRYYSHGGMTVAMRTSGALTWLAGDHQGTTQVAINANDLTVKQRRQTPFGAQRGPNTAMPGERGFVGGTIDASTGLVHLGARDYDADLGRFVSLDPIMDPSSPQQINGYNYANNNPVALSDPTGLAPEDSPGYCVGRYGDCGIDPAVGSDIRGHYSDEQLTQKGVKRDQPAAAEKRRQQQNRAQATGSKRQTRSVAEWVDVALPPFSGVGAVWHLLRAESASEAGHGVLDLVGYIPLVGEVADLANAGWYAGEGDDVNAALSAAAAIPFVGWGAAAVKAGKQGLKGAGDGVDIFKAPGKGMTDKLVDDGFDAADFPGSGNGFPDGHAYFGMRDEGRQIALDYAGRGGYDGTVIRVQIPQADFDNYFSKYVRAYDGRPDAQIAIPNTVFDLLNKYPRVKVDG